MKRKTNKNLILGGLLVGIMLCMIAVGFFWTPYDPEAMDSAETLVRCYASAGFAKLHLDTSMKLADDDPDARLPDEVIAARAARRRGS